MKHALILVILASACGGGSAPELSEFQITTSPIVRGQQIEGSVKVRDLDGLGGIRLRGELSGPASATLDVPAQGVSDVLTEGTLGLILFLSTEAPAGPYTATLVATDAEDLESDPVTAEMEVQ